MVKKATNPNGECQNVDMPKRRQTVNNETVSSSSRILSCGHSTQYSHLVCMNLVNCCKFVDIILVRTVDVDSNIHSFYCFFSWVSVRLYILHFADTNLNVLRSNIKILVILFLYYEQYFSKVALGYTGP